MSDVQGVARKALVLIRVKRTMALHRASERAEASEADLKRLGAHETHRTRSPDVARVLRLRREGN